MPSPRPLVHLLRRVPPWRVEQPLTECGRDSATVEAYDVLPAGRRPCASCHRHAVAQITWASWEAAPLALVARDLHGLHYEIATVELWALASLAMRHQGEFETLLQQYRLYITPREEL